MACRKKKFSSRRYREFAQRKRLLTALIILFACFIVWGTLLFLSELGPKKTYFKPAQIKENTQLPDKPHEKMPTEDLKAMSLELEAEAQALLNAGDYETASVKYREAFELQRNINRNYPLSSEQDTGRAIRLQLKAKNAAAEPLFLNSLDLEQQADSSLRSGASDSAGKALRQAIAFQQQLNNEYREARQASTLRLEQLKEKLALLESSEAYSAIKEVLEQADSLQAAGKMKQAGDLYDRAAFLQEQLNEQFPDSPHVSRKQIHEFRTRSQT